MATLESSSAAATVATARGSRGELIAKLGAIVSAIVASSCCWLPVLLLAVGISGAGIASAMEAYRPYLIVLTFGFLGMAFYFTYRRRPATSGGDCCAPAANASGAAAPAKRGWNMMAINKAMLWVVTLLAVVFLFFPQFVTGLFGKPGSDVITADMQRTELTIVGMTCYG